jgi:hypothetical protein
MRQFPLDQLDKLPGHVVEWQLKARDATALSQRVEHRKNASFNQSKHFSSVKETRNSHNPLASWLAITLELDGVLNRGALEAALLFLARRHEVLRCEFQHLAGDLSCDVCAPEDIELEACDCGDVGTTAELQAFLMAGFERNTDTLAWPLYTMGAVIRDDGPTTVYLAFDHIVSDGISLLFVVNDIEVAYAAFCRGEEVDLPAVGGYADFAHEQRARYGSIDDADDRLDYWKAFASDGGEFFPRFPLDIGVEPGSLHDVVSDSGTLLSFEEAEAFDARCREAGGKVFMGVLAAVAISLRKEGGPDVYRGLMPVSERGRGEWQKSVGWFVNTLPIEFSVAADLEFAQIMAGVRAGFTEMMTSADVPFVRAWQLLSPELFSLHSWPYPVNFFSYIDTTRFPGSEHHEGWNPTAYVWSANSNSANSWFLRDAEGVHFNSIYADTPKGRAVMAGVHRSLRETLQAMAAVALPAGA